MSDTALSKAWRWSVAYSPLLNLWRWIRHKGYPNRKAFALLDSAALPEQIDALIRTTVKRSKLWASERAEIAREFVAHAQDALEAERTDEEIAQSFGSPRRIAKLLRRSMKRKRPLYWRAYRYTRRVTAVMIVILIVGYGGLVARFSIGKPRIQRNFFAELNAQNDGYSEDEKAWPIYRSVGIELEKLTLAARKRELANGSNSTEWKHGYSWLTQILNLEADNPESIQVTEMIRSFEPQLARLREAGHRPVSGMMLSDQVDSVEVEPGVWVDKPIAPSSDPRLQGSLIYLLLPDLYYTKAFARLLIFDAGLAMEEGDWDRAHADISSASGMCRQVNRQGFLINHLSAIAILDDVSAALESLIAEYPEAFSSEQLIEFSHQLAMSREKIALTLDREIMFFDDLLQRTYTDDGHGNGRLTRRGLEILLNDGWANPDDEIEVPFKDAALSLAGPVTMFAIEDRQSQSRRSRAITERAFRALRDGPESLGGIFADDAQAELSSGGILRSPVDLVMPGYGKAVEREFLSQMRTDATLAMFAIEIFRRKNGEYPETLDELVPQYLPEIPADHFNPGHPIQYLLDGGRYALFSAGTDGDLDGGRDLKPTKAEQYSLKKRFEYQTVIREDGGVEVVLDEDGNPILVNPDEPDSDWVIIDMRRVPEAPDTD